MSVADDEGKAPIPGAAGGTYMKLKQSMAQLQKVYGREAADKGGIGKTRDALAKALRAVRQQATPSVSAISSAITK